MIALCIIELASLSPFDPFFPRKKVVPLFIAMLVAVVAPQRGRGALRLLPFHGLYDDASDIPSFDVFDLTPSSCEFL